jgi:hypothetical protein
MIPVFQATNRSYSQLAPLQRNLWASISTCKKQGLSDPLILSDVPCAITDSQLSSLLFSVNPKYMVWGPIETPVELMALQIDAERFWKRHGVRVLFHVSSTTPLIAAASMLDILIDCKPDAWDYVALRAHRVSLAPCADYRIQWLTYCELVMRAVGISLVVLSDQWCIDSKQGVVYAINGLAEERLKSPHHQVARIREINLRTLDMFWEAERLRITAPPLGDPRDNRGQRGASAG